METPDKWLIFKIDSEQGVLYKVFATWYGGYLDSERWRANSGITRVEEDEKSFKFYGYSGSCYECLKGTYGTSMYSQSILNNAISSAEKVGVTMTIMPEDTDWKKLLE